MSQPLAWYRLGCQPYKPVWQAMQTFTQQRQVATADTLWLVEHPPVYTQGLAGRAEHVLGPSNIPVVHVDRGGQVTYHGPGQVVAYPLLDLRRMGIGVRQLVNSLQQAVVNLLADNGIIGYARADAPGVYVDQAKVAAIGLRVRRGCCYHGISLNVDMDLGPFNNINPCGFAGLAVTQLRDLGGPTALTEVGEQLATHCAQVLGYRGAALRTGLPSPLQQESA